MVLILLEHSFTCFVELDMGLPVHVEELEACCWRTLDNTRRQLVLWLLGFGDYGIDNAVYFLLLLLAWAQGGRMIP